MTELATQDKTQAPASQIALFQAAGIRTSAHSDAEFDKVASGFGYLPRIQHFTDASGDVKRKVITAGFYLVSGKDDRVPLGEDIDIVPVAWRFKALETIPGQKPVSSTDPNSDTFKSIAARSNQPNSNCQAGIEYLAWVPAAAKFATYLMGSKTALREAAKMKPYLGAAVTVKTHTYENPQNIWQGPKVYESSVPVDVLPDVDLLKETVERFNNPPAEEQGELQEKVEAKGATKRAR
jgi:hypothetical protein